MKRTLVAHMVFAAINTRPLVNPIAELGPYDSSVQGLGALGVLLVGGLGC